MQLTVTQGAKPMTYVVFRKNVDGTVNKLSTHRSERGAKISMSAAQKRENSSMGVHAMVLREVPEKFYRTRIVQNILVRNLVSGEIMAIPNDTPMVQATPTESKTAKHA